MTKNKIIIFNILSMFYLEMVFHLFIFKNISFLNVFFIFLSSILSGILISIFLNFSNKKINLTIHLTLISITTIIFAGQLIHYKFYESLFSLYSMFHSGQVFAFVKAILNIIKENIIPFILMFLPLVALIINSKKLNYPYEIKMPLKLAISYLVIYITFLFLLNLDQKELYSAKNLYYKVNAPTLTAQKLGISRTMSLDLKRSIFPLKEKTIEITKENTYDLEEYNLENIDFAKMPNTNNSLNTLNNYFKKAEPTNKNQYTGIFKDKNLIIITAESFSPLAIDEKLTPTLFKLTKESINFENYYTPIYYTSTSDGEYMYLNSLLPKEGIWSFPESHNNYFKYNYTKLLKELGYSANAYHNGTYNYYNRYLTHTNLGYNFNACGMGLETKINCDIWPASDEEMINETIDDYINNEHFLVYYMTVSGHLNYTSNLNAMVKKNYNQVKDLNLNQNLKGYLAANIELDKAIESLITKLEEKNKLDNTVIVISGDHYPYGLTKDEIKEKATYLKDERFDLHKNKLIIWNNAQKNNLTINKYISNLDVLPTILNLFGLTYDSRLLIGQDIFSNSEGLVIFNDRSWITNQGKYNTLTKKFTPFNQEVNQEYINSINNIVYNKFLISKLIQETNYYQYLEDLNKS